MSKKYLDTVGLNKLVANILSKFAAKNHKHSAATTNSAGFMSSSDKVKLDGVAAGANKTIVDSSLNDTSTNPIQNKAVKTALDGKAASSHTHPTAQITGLDSALAGKAPISHNHNGVYAASSHSHSADNITSGVLPIGRGGTGANNATGAVRSFFPKTGNLGFVATIGNDWSGGYRANADLANDLYPTIKAKTDAVYQPKGNYAASSHSHSADNITSGVLPIGRGGTGGASAAAANYNILSGIPASSIDAADTDKFVVMHTSPTTSTGRLLTKTAAQVWAWIKSKTDPLYAARTHNHDSAYAAKSHNHSTDNITSGVLPIGRGGTGGDSITAAAASLKYYPLGDKTSIPENADLNTYKTAGVYVCPLDNRAQTIKNCPTGGMSFSLEVDYVIATGKYLIQTLRQYNNAKVYKRRSDDSGTTWSAWQSLVMSNDTISIQHGGTGATTAARAVANLFPKAGNLGYVATIGSDWSGGYRSYNDLINDTWSIIKSKTDPLYQPKGSYAASSHTHTISNVTNLQTELDKKQVKIQPVTTAGTGSAYTATVPHIKTLATGVSFTMVPHVVSAAVSPTLNVNNLGAKPIRQRLSNSTQSTATGATANWLAAGKPVDVMYDGASWVVDFVRPNMASAYGMLPVANGGVPSCTASDNGKFLRVVNGVATWSTISNAENVSF